MRGGRLARGGVGGGGSQVSTRLRTALSARLVAVYDPSKVELAGK